MAAVKLKLVAPKDLSHEELSRLFAARELNLGKPIDFARLIQNVWAGTWDLYRIDGGIKGVCVLNPEGRRLNVFYLHGDGLFGKIRQLAAHLMDIAEKGGYEGLSCYTRDVRSARLFRMAPGVVCHKSDTGFILELNHGR